MMVRPLVRHLTPSFIIRSSGRAAALVVAFAAAHCLTAALFSSVFFYFLKKASNSRRTRKRQSTKMRYNPVASHTIQGKYPPRMKIQEKRAEPAPPSTPKVHTKGKEKRTTNGKKNWKKKGNTKYVNEFAITMMTATWENCWKENADWRWGCFPDSYNSFSTGRKKRKYKKIPKRGRREEYLRSWLAHHHHL